MNSGLIIISEYCREARIEPSFVLLLEEVGLIEIDIIENERYFHESQLRDLEKFARMYYDLSINIEGIDVINQLLAKIEMMRDEIKELKNRLSLYVSKD